MWWLLLWSWYEPECFRSKYDSRIAFRCCLRCRHRNIHWHTTAISNVDTLSNVVHKSCLRKRSPVPPPRSSWKHTIPYHHHHHHHYGGMIVYTSTSEDMFTWTSTSTGTTGNTLYKNESSALGREVSFSRVIDWRLKLALHEGKDKMLTFYYIK